MPLAYDVVVVGGGPAGLSVAEKVAQHGFSVAVLEEHGEIGRPLKCTGILLERDIRALGLEIPEEIVLFRTHEFVLHVRNKLVELSLPPFEILVTDRPKLDKWLAKKSAEAGADLFLAHKCSAVERKGDRWKVRARESYACSFLVEADGISQDVSRILGKAENLKPMPCLQYEVAWACKEVHVFLWGDGFGWVVPSGRRSRVGVATRFGLLSRIKELMRSLGIPYKPVSAVSASFPTSGPLPCAFGSFFKVGDCAGHVNPLVGAGIASSIMAGRIVGEAIAGKVPDPSKKIDEEFGESFRLYRRLREYLERNPSSVFALTDSRIPSLLESDMLGEFAKLLIQEPSLLEALFRHGRRILRLI